VIILGEGVKYHGYFTPKFFLYGTTAKYCKGEEKRFPWNFLSISHLWQDNMRDRPSNSNEIDIFF